MKNIIILIALFANCYLANAQEKSFDNILDFGLPKEIEKSDRQNLQSFIQNRKNSQIDYKTNKGNIYKINNIIITINAGSGKVAANFLEESKNFSDELAPKIPTQKNYSAKIISNNNSRSLLTHYDSIDFSYYIIQSVNLDNNKTSIVRIEYKKEDELKATKIVDYILKNMRFK